MNAVIYTDGSCKSNPGNGGWAFLMSIANGNMLLSYGAVENTTNNRMEMTAVINGLLKAQSLGYKDVTIITDSKYVENTINNGWLDKWIDSSFAGKKNIDLWVRLYGLLCSMNVKIKWTKGHHEDPYNMPVDHYASTVAGTNMAITESLIKREYEKK